MSNEQPKTGGGVPGDLAPLSIAVCQGMHGSKVAILDAEIKRLRESENALAATLRDEMDAGRRIAALLHRMLEAPTTQISATWKGTCCRGLLLAHASRRRGAVHAALLHMADVIGGA